MSKATNKFAPEFRDRAVRMSDNGPRYIAGDRYRIDASAVSSRGNLVSIALAMLSWIAG